MASGPAGPAAGQGASPGIGSPGYLAPGYGAPPGPGGHPAQPGPVGRIGPPIASGSVREPPPRWMKVTAILLAALVVAAGGYILLLGRTSGSGLRVPGAIAGAPQVVTAATRRSVTQFEADAKRLGVSAYASFYGANQIPTMALLAYDYPRKAGESVRQVWAQFAPLFAAEAGRADVDPESMKASSDATADYLCARIVGQIRGSLCMWQDDRTVGLLLQYQRTVRQTRRAVAAARTAVEP